MYRIQRRHTIMMNDDPQGRCYNGAYFKSSYQWTGWYDLQPMETKAKAIEAVDYFRELNDYAVLCRGKQATAQYRWCVHESGMPTDAIKVRK